MNEFKLVVDEQDVSIISAGLGKLPYEVVKGLIDKLQAQINDQLPEQPIVPE